MTGSMAPEGRRLRRLLERGGWTSRPGERTVLFVGVDAAACEAVEALISALRQRYGRLHFAFVTRGPELRGWLAALGPGHHAFAAPWCNQLSSLLFLLTTRTRLVVAMRGIGNLDRRIAGRAYTLGIPIVVLDAVARDRDSAGRRRREDPWLLSRVELFMPRDAAAAAELRLQRIAPERISAPEATPLDPPMRAQRIVDAMAPLVGRRPPVRRPLQRSVVKALDNPALRRVIRPRTHRIDSIEELRAALGSPDVVLCLGNGPSSEDPVLADIAHDVLFRVNHRWKERGFLAEPDLVFTGGKRALFTVRAPIFGFQTRSAEAHLATHQIFNPFCGRMQYVVLERLGVLEAVDEGGLRPTNGAGMLATAVALEPKRLIVSGMDLFQHPEGSYPGDARTPNAYVPAHDAELELRFLQRTLDAYRGELVVLSPALAQHLRQGRRQTT